jgi:hypothetical protein
MAIAWLSTTMHPFSQFPQVGCHGPAKPGNRRQRAVIQAELLLPELIIISSDQIAFGLNNRIVLEGGHLKHHVIHNAP